LIHSIVLIVKICQNQYSCDTATLVYVPLVHLGATALGKRLIVSHCWRSSGEEVFWWRLCSLTNQDNQGTREQPSLKHSRRSPR